MIDEEKMLADIDAAIAQTYPETVYDLDAPRTFLLRGYRTALRVLEAAIKDGVYDAG